MDIPQDYLKEKISQLERRRSEVVVFIDARTAELTKLDFQLEALRGLVEDIANAEKARNIAAHEPNKAVTQNGDYSMMGPTQAIYAYLQTHPGSLPNEIVRAISPTVRSNATDRERMVYSIIYQLEDKRKIVRHGKKLRVPDAGG